VDAPQWARLLLRALSVMPAARSHALSHWLGFRRCVPNRDALFQRRAAASEQALQVASLVSHSRRVAWSPVAAGRSRVTTCRVCLPLRPLAARAGSITISTAWWCHRCATHCQWQCTIC